MNSIPTKYIAIHFQRLASSSSTSDLSGFDCTLELELQQQRRDMHMHMQPVSAPIVAAVPPSCTSFQFPPSPPPTNSDPKRSVPLPTIQSPNADPSPQNTHFEPESPAVTVTKHVALGLDAQAPLTPPPTLPTPTLALPPTDHEFSLSPISEDAEASLLGLPSSSSSPDQAQAQDQDPGARLLSPLSPEWSTNGISYELLPPSIPYAGDTSVLLCGNHHPHHHHEAEPFRYVPDAHLDTNSTNTPSPPSPSRPVLPLLGIPDLHFPPPKSAWSESSPSSATDLDIDIDIDMDYDEDMDMDMDSDMDMDMDLALLSTPTSPPPSPFLTKLALTLDDLDLDHDLDLESGHDTAAYPYQHQHQYRQPFPHPSPPPIHQISHLHSHPHLRTQPHTHTQPLHFLPELDELDDIPTSPTLRSFAALPPLSDSDSDHEGEGEEEEEGEVDDPMPMPISPPSPSPFLSLSPSPAHTLLALPGADTDDFLLPPDLPAPTSTKFKSKSKSSVLFFPDPDPDSDSESFSSGSGSRSSLLLFPSPPSTSTSPPNIDLDLDLELDQDPTDPTLLRLAETHPDPDVRRICALRRRVQEGERAAARAQYADFTEGEGGALGRGWEARRVGRRERERGEEVWDLLRLKVGNGPGVSGSVGVMEQEKAKAGEQEKEKEGEKERMRIMTKWKRGPQSMEQLVARMLLRRNESEMYRSLAPWAGHSNSKGKGKGRGYPSPSPSSPLARTAYLVPQGEDGGEDEDDVMWDRHGCGDDNEDDENGVAFERMRTDERVQGIWSPHPHPHSQLWSTHLAHPSN
ncbi:hypothetical protein D9615_002117 [Tricholomella constricta]|uniref:Uncharacterized protein n=1 Tax=Tricholomella constricta TaxID=117010 RepID=A0A8H5HPQ3_9AGAR|nr:hypothetical protein D9615_002117 [Tricholomella constricta]